MESSIRVLPFLFMGLLCLTFFILWLRKEFLYSKMGAREFASRANVTVTPATCSMYLSSNHGVTYALEAGDCVKYSIPLNGTGFQWVLKLLPNNVNEPLIPELINLNSDNPLPSQLLLVLQIIGTEWSPNFMLIESSPDSLDFYWEEFGGARVASKIVGYMLNIRDYAKFRTTGKPS